MKRSENTARAVVCKAEFAVHCNVHMQWDGKACVHGCNGVVGVVWGAGGRHDTYSHPYAPGGEETV